MGPIWKNSEAYGNFVTLIPMVQKFLKFSPSFGTLPIYMIDDNFVDFTEQVISKQISA